MPRFVTHAEIARVPDEGVFYLEEGAELTPLAEERAAARRIELRRTAAPVASADPKELEEAARRILQRLGPVDKETAQRVVAEVVASIAPGSVQEGVGLPTTADYCTAYLDGERRRNRRRAVLTATGRNQKGIVARLTTVIAELGGDILDISQTLVGDYFTMLVIVDIAELGTSFEQFKEALTQAARERGVQTILMHEDLVTSMHRV
jgi:ACT domain-containing protein